MKIAIPTMDGQTISAHFGRSRQFLVLEVTKGEIRSRELRANDQVHGSQDPNGEAHACGHGHGHDHDHGGFVRLLSDCSAVICGGMGGGARRALEGAGLKVCLVDVDRTPEEAAKAHESGDLQEREGADCGCRGKH